MMEFIKAIALQSDYPEAYIELADVYKKKNLHDTAILVCKQLLTVKQNYSPAQYTIASVYALKNDSKNSIKWLTWALTQEPDYINKIEKDTDFNSIKKSKEFRKLLKQRNNND